MRSKRFPVVIIFTFLLCGVVAGVSLERYTAKERVLNSITSFIVYFDGALNSDYDVDGQWLCLRVDALEISYTSISNLPFQSGVLGNLDFTSLRSLTYAAFVENDQEAKQMLQKRTAECKQLLADYEFKNPSLGARYLSWPFPFLDSHNALINDLLCILTDSDSVGMDG